MSVPALHSSCTFERPLLPGTLVTVNGLSGLRVTVGYATGIQRPWGGRAWRHYVEPAPEDAAAVWEVLSS